MLASMICVAVLPPAVANVMFGYFDIFAIGWLILGLIVGRKRGMSQEFLPLLQWIGIVTAAGLLYAPFSPIIHQCTQFTPLWSNITAYLLIAIGVHFIYLGLKRMLAERLVKKDLFGRSEFYLGMVVGFARFGCMLLALIALMNSKVATAAELKETEKFQAAWFSDIRFPTYGEFQQDVLFKSCTGNFVETNLKPILIATASNEAGPKSETIAQKSNKIIDDILNQTTKK